MLTTSILPPKCTLVIEETIPRGMYVDPDQLRDLQESTGFATYIPTKVDVEKPEFESESFRVFIFRRLGIQENLRVTNVQLPLHMRYHKPAQILETKPSSSAPTAIIKLQNPRLLLSCEGENVAAHCPDKSVTSFCDASGTEKCEYLQIPYEVVSHFILQRILDNYDFVCPLCFQNTIAIEVSVPVGNTDHTGYVVGLTTFLVSGSTVYLMVTLFRKDFRSHQD